MRFLWLTDVPTPYRNHSFERMAAIFPKMGIEFEVAFMAMRSKRRPWTFAEDDLRFPYVVGSGLHPLVAGAEMHLNPAFLGSLRRHPPDMMLVGGWASPTHLMAPWCVPDKTVRVLGCESNPESVSRTSAFANWIKSRTVDRYDAFLVPQRRSLELLRSLSPSAASRPHVIFPNIIDSRVFAAGVAAARARGALRAALGVSEVEQLWLCSARLASEKGLLEFLPLLEQLSNITLLVAGEGPLRPQLEALVRERKLPARFIGQQSEAQMLELYAAADLFVLPSLRDPSPLSVIEACAAALPLVVSNRVGNVDDVLCRGENGWLYDANNPSSNLDMLTRAASTPRNELAQMGAISRGLYQQRFDSDTCVERLGAALIGFYTRLR